MKEKIKGLTDLLLEARSLLHGVHHGVRDAAVQVPDRVLDVQGQRVVLVIHRHHETLHGLHVLGPRKIQLGGGLGQAAPAGIQKKKKRNFSCEEEEEEDDSSVSPDDRRLPHDVGAESPAGHHVPVYAPALGAVGHPEQGLVAALLLAAPREHESVGLLEHALAERQRLDQDPGGLQALAEGSPDLLGYVAEGLELLHVLVQAALELVGKVLLARYRVNRLVVGYGEEPVEELGESLVQHVLAQRLLEALVRVGRGDVVDHRLVQAVYRRLALDGHGPVDLVEQRQGLVLGLSSQHRDRFCNVNNFSMSFVKLLSLS